MSHLGYLACLLKIVMTLIIHFHSPGDEGDVVEGTGMTFVVAVNKIKRINYISSIN